MLYSRNLIQLWVSKNKRFKTRKMTERPWNLDIVVYFSEKKQGKVFFAKWSGLKEKLITRKHTRNHFLFQQGHLEFN